MSREAVERIADPHRCPTVLELREARTADLVAAFHQVGAVRSPDAVGQRIRLNRIECELHARDAGVRG